MRNCEKRKGRSCSRLYTSGSRLSEPERGNEFECGEEFARRFLSSAKL